MKEFYLKVLVDEDEVKKAAETDDIEEAIRNEAGWMEESGISVEEVCAAENFALEVPTSAGVIKAYKSTDPDQPGIVTVIHKFQSAEKEDIDAAYVSVYEDKEERIHLRQGRICH